MHKIWSSCVFLLRTSDTWTLVARCICGWTASSHDHVAFVGATSSTSLKVVWPSSSSDIAHFAHELCKSLNFDFDFPAVSQWTYASNVNCLWRFVTELKARTRRTDRRTDGQCTMCNGAIGGRALHNSASSNIAD